ncbi:MAG: hypothetical protein ABJC36_00320 [Gemmatimonadales bacterium]
MTDDERRRFALAQGGTAGGPAGEDAADELDLEDPGAGDTTGRTYARPADEVADPDARDGEAALLDDAAHVRNVEAQRKQRRRG